jgi:hypothetical protein
MRSGLTRTILAAIAAAVAAGLAAASADAKLVAELTPPHRTCTWGGTATAPTGISEFDPITNLPATRPLRFAATGVLGGDCRGRFSFKGKMNAGSTCALISFDGAATGLPGVARFAGHSVAGVAPARLFDRRGNVVGSENAQFLNNSNLMDCAGPRGLTRVRFSSVIELFQ